MLSYFLDLRCILVSQRLPLSHIHAIILDCYFFLPTFSRLFPAPQENILENTACSFDTAVSIQCKAKQCFYVNGLNCFVKICLFYVHMCYVHADALGGQRSVECPDTGVAGGCEPPDVGARN